MRCGSALQLEITGMLRSVLLWSFVVAEVLPGGFYSRENRDI